MTQKLKAIIYSLLSVFLILFAIILYQKGNPKVCGFLYIVVIFTIGLSYLLKNLCQIKKNIKNNYYLVRIKSSIFTIVIYIVYYIYLLLTSLRVFIENSIEIFSSQKKYLKFIIISVFVINLIFYVNNYNKFQNNILNTIIFFIGILTIFLIWCYKKQIFILILTFIIIIIVSILLGLLYLTDFSIAPVIFLFGLLFAIIENIEKFIKLDSYYPREIITLENDDKIKRNKLVLNFFIGLLFISAYSFCKILITHQSVKGKILEYTGLTKLYEPLALGLLVLIILEILTILFLYIFSKLLQKISKHSKVYNNQEAVGLFYSILTFGIKNDVTPKVIDKIAIGNGDIDQINPKVFLENIREIPKDIHILLSKVEDVSIIRKLFPKKDVPTIRKLLIIYPNKEVYSCKLSISKNIVKRISEIKSEDTVNKQKE